MSLRRTLRGAVSRIRMLVSSDASLTKKASLNATASGLEYAARALTGFFVTPVLVHGLGTRDYGLWLILGRLTGYLTAASGRSPQALKWTIAKQQGSDDHLQKQQTVASAFVAWLVFLPVMASLGGALIWFAPTWLSTPVELVWTLRLVGAILVMRLIVTALAALPRSVLEGENLGYKRMGLAAVLVVVGGGLVVLAVVLDTGLIGVASASLLTAILTGLLYVVLARSNVPWFGAARPKRGQVGSFLQLSVWFVLWRLVNQLMISSDIVILGVAESPDFVSTYALTKYVPEVLVNLVGVLVFASAPGLSGVLGAGQIARAARLREELMVLTWLFLTTSGATLLLWNEAFLELWVGDGHYAGTTATLLIVVMICQYVLLRSDANVIDLTLDVSRKVLLGALSVTVSIVASAVAVTILDAGIPGLCLGLIAGRLILSVAYPLMVGRLLSLPPGSQVRAILRPAATAIVLFAVSLALRRWIGTTPLFTPSNWLHLILLGVPSGVACAVVAFAAGLSARQRTLILQRARRLFEAATPPAA